MEHDPNNSRPNTPLIRHATPLIILGLLSLIVAMLVTPADPVSFLVAAIFIGPIGFLGYLLGLRAGRAMHGGNIPNSQTDVDRDPQPPADAQHR